jgi:predicted NBD/HSP70 family sugar kinase
MERRVLSANERLVVELLLEHGSLSRTALARSAGLSKPATNDLVQRLVDAGFVAAVGEVSSDRRGPNAVHFRAVTELAHVAGVEMQPEHVHVAIAGLAGRPLVELDLPRDGASPAAHVAEAVRRAAAEIGLGTSELWKVVVGTPGVVTPDGDVGFVAGHPDWHTGQRDRLSEALGCPVRLENDVNLAALAESEEGRGADVDSFTLLRLDEGIGAATVLGGVLLRGARGYAGEIGFAPAMASSERIGSSETGYQSWVGRAAIDALVREQGMTHVSAAEVLSAPDTETGAARVRAEVVRRVAALVATVSTAIDPERFVLSGALGEAGGERLAKEIEETISRDSPLRVEVVPAALGSGSVVIGALALVIDDLRDHVYGTPAAPASSRAWRHRRGDP